jgi:hypothetical protein
MSEKTSIISRIPREARLAKLLEISTIVTGLILATFGFYVDHGQENEWVTTTFAPGYAEAVRAYERMYSQGEIEHGDEGFAQIASLFAFILADKLPDLGTLTITRVVITQHFPLVIRDNGYRGPSTDVNIYLNNGNTVVTLTRLGDLRPQLKEHFLDHPLYVWGQRFFWLGIIITFATPLLERLLRHPADTKQQE